MRLLGGFPAGVNCHGEEDDVSAIKAQPYARLIRRTIKMRTIAPTTAAMIDPISP